MGTKLKNIMHSFVVKCLLVSVIFISAVFFIEQMYFYFQEQQYYYLESFEDTSEYSQHYENLLVHVEAALMQHRSGNSFSVEGIEKDLDYILRFLPSFKYRLENRDEYGIAKSSPYEAFSMKETTLFAGNDAFSWPTAVRVEQHSYFTSRFGEHIETINRALPDDWKLLISISPEQDQGELGTAYSNFNTAHTMQTFREQMMMLYLGVAAIAFLILNRVSGRNEVNGPVQLNLIDRIPLEILFTAVGLALVLLFQSGYSDSASDSMFGVQGILISSLALLLIVYFSLVRRLKARRFFMNFFLIRIGVWLIHQLSPSRWQQTFKPILLVYLALFSLLNLLLGIILPTLGPLGVLLWFGVNAGVLYWSRRELEALLHLQSYVNKQVQGQLDVGLNEQLVTPMMKEFAQDLSQLHTGLEIAVSDAMKNERMRTELIANVTHDLKNPLTSIISYVDLLSKENLDNSTAIGYVHILQDKSQRLKVLIDHLVEASKISSGVVEAKLTPIDLVAFLNQLEGEFGDDFAKQKLVWRMSSNHPIAMVSVDDRMLLRILENLIGNIIKYAMPGTRVYLDVSAMVGQDVCVREGSGPKGVILTLKNISEHPLSISTDELTERFVRADSARNSEGNGLGLSIAKSLAAAMNCTLDITVDGDMFKATVHFPPL